jgi:hypothetical protein
MQRAARRRSTNKTEFMRYLDENSNACPLLRTELKLYRGTHSKFGFWVRIKHPSAFARAYDGWWVHRPRLFGQIYAGPADPLMP